MTEENWDNSGMAVRRMTESLMVKYFVFCILENINTIWYIICSPVDREENNI